MLRGVEVRGSSRAQSVPRALGPCREQRKWHGDEGLPGADQRIRAMSHVQNLSRHPDERGGAACRASNDPPQGSFAARRNRAKCLGTRRRRGGTACPPPPVLTKAVISRGRSGETLPKERIPRCIGAAFLAISAPLPVGVKRPQAAILDVPGARAGTLFPASPKNSRLTHHDDFVVDRRLWRSRHRLRHLGDPFGA